MPVAQQAPDAQQQPVQAAPVATPFFAQPAPNWTSPAQQGVQAPFAPAPQPYELYENTIKNAIAFLNNLLSQSQAARAAVEPKADSQADQPEQTDQDAQANVPFAPFFGCQQPPMPNQPMQQSPGVGMLPTNNYLGGLLGSLFGATNTDYFYED